MNLVLDAFRNFDPFAVATLDPQERAEADRLGKAMAGALPYAVICALVGATSDTLEHWFPGHRRTEQEDQDLRDTVMAFHIANTADWEWSVAHPAGKEDVAPPPA